jgi:hypothetical protein
MRKPLLAALLVLSTSLGDANAVGLKTQLNCASDYYAYCSQFPVGSSGVRKCMKENGSRLSKACVNALLADGEISKAEVERTKEKIAVAKAKPKPEPSKVAQVADAPQKPRQKVVASPDILEQEQRLASKTEPIIDKRTYEALRSRTHFLADSEVVESSTVVQSLQPTGATSGPTEPLAYKEPTAPSIDTVDLEPKPPVAAVARRATAEPNHSRLPPAEKSQAVETSKQARGSIDTSAGRMSLGQNPSPDQANRPEPSNSQAWSEYMQSRFNGGMNYEGVGARFSKGP